MEVMESVGSTMSNIERWLTEERSYGITGASILLSVLLSSFLIWAFSKKIHSINNFVLDGKSYEIAGLAMQNDHGNIFYTPVYKERK